jgi:hypothetical protein
MASLISLPVLIRILLVLEREVLYVQCLILQPNRQLYRFVILELH